MANLICTVDGCERAATSGRYCSAHRQRWVTQGTVAADRPIRPKTPNGMPLLDRLWSKVERGPGCWLWTSACRSDGYGVLKVKGLAVAAHRLCYELVVGPIPEGLTLDHLCRVRRCIRPDHLEPVTLRENIRREMRYRYRQAQHEVPLREGRATQLAMGL